MLTKTNIKKYFYITILVISIGLLIITNSEIMIKAKQIQAMNITETSPKKILAGSKFNLYNDESLIIINGSGFMTESKLYVNNKPIVITCATENYISGILPDKCYDDKATLKLQLKRAIDNDLEYVSNQVEIPIVKIEKEVQNMKVSGSSPLSIERNKKFNVFNGQSALGLTGDNFNKGCKIYANDQELETTFGNDQFITAVVPEQLYSKKGSLKIKVKFNDIENEVIHTSNTITISIK